MAQSAFTLLVILFVLVFVHADDAQQAPVVKKPSDPLVHEGAIPHNSIPHETEKMNSIPQQADHQHADQHHSQAESTENKNPDSHHSEVKHPQIQLSKTHHSESQQTSEHQSETQPSVSQHSKNGEATSRQFHQPLPYHPMLFQPPTGFEAIRRQFGGGLGSDLVMVGLISLPIIGLLTMGSASLGNLLGLGLSSSNSKKSSSKRTKRSLKEKAADAVEYAKNLWNVMEQLEKAFEKYDLYQAECRLRVVCEAHHKDRRMGSWGQSILDLMRQQKELEGRELLPVSRFLFSNYAEAAQAGARNENCAQLYTGCPRHLSYYLSAKEDEEENEVDSGIYKIS